MKVAEIDKSNEVIDGLHKYKAKCIVDKYMIPTLVQCVYGYYIPSENLMKPKQIKIVNTIEEFLKSKYNPNFLKEN